MSSCMKIALIPAYKPDKEMLGIVEQLANRNFSVVVVNDGSGEEFGSIFENAAENSYVKVLVHDVNRGKGEALKTGLRYIRENFTAPYCVVTVDADGQHRINDIVNVCDKAVSNPEALILGSRRFDNNVPLRSRLGNTLTRFVYRISTGASVFDTQTGLRAFSDKLIDKLLNIEGSRYEYEMNVIMEAARGKTEIIEVWIETVYLNDNSSSHFNTVKDSYRIYKEILKFSASSLLSFLADYTMFCLFSALTGALVFSNVAARVFSSVLNYTINKKLVFKSEGETVKSAVKYFMLAAFILMCNTFLLKALTLIGLNTYLAKIFTEILLFTFNYFIQHCFIFRKEHKQV